MNEASQVGSSGLHLLVVFNVGNHCLVMFVGAPRNTIQVVKSFLSETNFGSGSRGAAAMIQRLGLSYSCPLLPPIRYDPSSSPPRPVGAQARLPLASHSSNRPRGCSSPMDTTVGVCALTAALNPSCGMLPPSSLDPRLWRCFLLAFCLGECERVADSCPPLVDGSPRSSSTQEPITGRKMAAAGRDGAAATAEGKGDG